MISVYIDKLLFTYSPSHPPILPLPPFPSLPLPSLPSLPTRVTGPLLFVVPGDVAVPGANLQLGGHHGSDAGGGPQVWDRRQLLARHHDGGRQGHALPDGDRAEQHAGPAAGGEHPAGRDPEGAERIPREETPLLPPVSSHHTPLTVSHNLSLHAQCVILN